MIDWTKPIQWSDGRQARVIRGPDYEGDYLVETIKDPDAFATGQAWVRPDGRRQGHLRNWATIENIPPLTDQIETWKREKEAELKAEMIRESLERTQGYGTW